VRFVAAIPLIKELPLWRNIHGFAAGDIFEVHDRVGDSALRPDNYAFQIANLVRLGITNLGVFGDGESRNMRLGAFPLNSTVYSATVGDSDRLITLPENAGCGREYCRGQQ
jgi:hypothetical protein